MDQIKRKRNIWNWREKRRAWAVLSVLWLVTACLAGCGQSGRGQAETQVGTRTVGVQTAFQGQESDSGSAAAGGESGRELSVEAQAEPGAGGEAAVSGQEAGNRETGVAGARQQGTEPEAGEKADAAEGKSAAAGQGMGNREEQPAAAGQDTGNHEVHKDSTGEDSKKESEAQESTPEEQALTVEESGSYTSKEEVALYIHLYGCLPGNYITKKQAEKLGWDSKAGNLWEVAPGMSIGGSRFGNYEGALPDKKGRTYYECDIDYDGGYRGAKRIIYSNDGLIYYTEDHYKTFEELYGQ